MLTALRTAIAFAPILAVVLVGLGGSLSAGAVVWKLKDFWFTTFTEPQIRREQREADVAEFERIAHEAKVKRELELFKLVDRWSNEIYLADVEDDAWDEAQRKLMQDKIDEYEQGAGDGGGGTLTDLDVRFLDGLLAQLGAASGGRSEGQGRVGRAGPSAGGAEGLH